MEAKLNADGEWIEPDGLGGFASGTVSGIRTRRYHAILLSAMTPPTGRMVLLNGFDAWMTTPAGTYALSSQRYTPDVIHPDGATRIESFGYEPWPHWVYALADGTRVEHEILAWHRKGVVGLRWRVLDGERDLVLSVRPFLSGRDYHALQHENGGFQFEPQIDGQRVVFHSYDGVSPVVSFSNGGYQHDPTWYRSFLYTEERARGLDFTEDLASPGVIRWDLSPNRDAVWILSPKDAGDAGPIRGDASKLFATIRREEGARRRRLRSALARAADAYLVPRGSGNSIVAGYPWFTDWGRDTFIALRGLAIATGRLEEAAAILLEWAGAVSEGMLPNRFPDHGETPEFNSVDASLWYVVAVEDFLAATDKGETRFSLAGEKRRRLLEASQAILEGYARGTRFGIRADEDGLLAAGVPGVQLTWMDAKVGDWVVTPRIGKPVEVQALWLNALDFAGGFDRRWSSHFARGRDAFRKRFWNERERCLYDVVDVDHRAGTYDSSFRPNQIFAVGGLPRMLLEPEEAASVVDAVEAKLLTPLGLRSLAPGSPGYRPRYEGGVGDRDGSYHQGTVWPWLLGPFIEAWIRVRGGTVQAKRQARRRLLAPLLRHLEEAGLGHISEIADAESPHTPRGCPFQAWSVGEALRVDWTVLHEKR